MYFSTLSILAEAPAGATGANAIFNSPIIPFACVALIMYVLMIRPQQKKQKELQALIASVKTGDRVVTNGGIHGIVSNVKDGTTLMLKIADNVKIEVDKAAIASVDRGSTSPAVVAA